MKSGRPMVAAESSFGAKARAALIACLFGFILLVPKALNLRRNRNSWLTLRIALCVAGAALVILPIGLWNSYVLAIGGLALFIGSILLPGAKPDTSTDRKARELGALVVVNGGRYQPGNAAVSAVELFIGTEHVWALGGDDQPLLVLPLAEITAVRAEAVNGKWVLRVQWADRSAEFTYRGIFAEHLARVAEATLRGVMRPALPVLPQRRAASA